MARRPTRRLKTALGHRAKALGYRVASPWNSTLIERRYNPSPHATLRTASQKIQTETLLINVDRAINRKAKSPA